MTTDPLAPPDRPERISQELLPWLDEQIAGSDAKVQRTASPSARDYYRGWRDACFNMKNKLRDVAVSARAHQEEKEHEMHEEKDDLARSGTPEIRDRQPAAVTDAGDQGDCAGTKIPCVIRETAAFTERSWPFPTLEEFSQEKTMTPVEPGEPHTPGPWKAGKGHDDEPDRSFVVQDIPGQPGYLIAEIHNGAPGDWLGTEVANARLIAAAPDMLAALKAIEASDSDPEMPFGQAWTQMLAAIAKAEGR